MSSICSVDEYLRQAAAVIVKSAESGLAPRIEQAITLLTDTVRAGKPILVCGNGGSAADAEHISGELVGRFLKERRGVELHLPECQHGRHHGVDQRLRLRIGVRPSG